MYNNCSCVAETLMYRTFLQENSTKTTIVPATTPDDISTMTPNITMNATGPPIGAFQGICMSDCKLLYTVAPILFLGMLLTFMTCSPVQTATLRYFAQFSFVWYSRPSVARTLMARLPRLFRTSS